MNTVITINNREQADPEHLEKALRCALRHETAVEANIYVQPRRDNGWLEYVVRVTYESGGGMTIGVIQRTPGAEVECHS